MRVIVGEYPPPGLEDFEILLFEAGGSSGAPGGQVLVDFMGNALGTTYLANGDVDTLGDGTIRTRPDGLALIRNLAPGKYGIQVVPPAGEGWTQTGTLEGGKEIDAFVKTNEPVFFTEFGPVGPHVFIGFTQAFVDDEALTGGATIEGRVVNLHTSRPPDVTFYQGEPWEHTTCWVGLNNMAVGEGVGVYVSRCNDDNTFSIAWDASDDIGVVMVAILLSTDGGQSWSDSLAGGSLSPPWEWQVPAINWQTCRIRIDCWDAVQNQSTDVSDADFAIQTAVSVDDLPTARVALHQNRPNPFNPRTEIRFALPAAQEIGLKVYDLEGRLVRILADGWQEAGEHTLYWHGENNHGERVASGIYFYRLITADRTITRKMALLK